MDIELLKSEFERVVNLVLSGDYMNSQKEVIDQFEALLKESRAHDNVILHTIAYAGFLCRRLTNANNYVYWKLVEAGEDDFLEFSNIRQECLVALEEILQTTESRFCVPA